MLRRTIPSLALLLMLVITAQSSYGTDSPIWEKLQGKSSKGYVLLLRHALAPGVGDPENFRLDDCSTQRNLSAEGREDARRVGRWIESLETTIYRVESSRWCRARETANLLDLGRVRLNRNLDSLFQESDIDTHPQTLQIRQQIMEHRKKRGLLILVGHYVNIAALTGVGVSSGEGVVVRANKAGEIRVLGATPPIER